MKRKTDALHGDQAEAVVRGELGLEARQGARPHVPQDGPGRNKARAAASTPAPRVHGGMRIEIKTDGVADLFRNAVARYQRPLPRRRSANYRPRALSHDDFRLPTRIRFGTVNLWPNRRLGAAPGWSWLPPVGLAVGLSHSVTRAGEGARTRMEFDCTEPGLLVDPREGFLEITSHPGMCAGADPTQMGGPLPVTHEGFAQAVTLFSEQVRELVLAYAPELLDDPEIWAWVFEDALPEGVRAAVCERSWWT